MRQTAAALQSRLGCAGGAGYQGTASVHGERVDERACAGAAAGWQLGGGHGRGGLCRPGSGTRWGHDRAGACRRCGGSGLPETGRSLPDSWEAWRADFFAPAAPLLSRAPWVPARGNHELCSRAGPGWFYFLDPHSDLLGGALRAARRSSRAAKLFPISCSRRPTVWTWADCTSWSWTRQSVRPAREFPGPLRRTVRRAGGRG